MRIQKSAFTNQTLVTFHLLVRKDHRKTTEVMKVLCIKCATVTGLPKRIAMAQNNKFFLVRHVYQ